MKYRKLGKTGLDVSVLSFGASSLGSVFRDIDEGEGIRTVHAAVDGGINLIDVSPYYGLTKAETVLGKAIRQLPRDSFILSTKAGRYGADQFDYSEARILASIDESLQRLQTEYVDILLLHDMEFVPFEQVVHEALPALRKIKQQGKARFIGVSGLPLDVFRKTLSVEELDVILSYCHYALNDCSLLELVPLLQDKRVGLINASPLSMGLLNGRPVPDWHPAPADIRERCKLAYEYCAGKREELSKLAIQYAVADERIPTTLVSTASVDNIVKNIRWTEEPLNEQLLQEVLELLAPVRNRTWKSGRPEYNSPI
ncbi:aldo/keto reductase [Paenibacillus alkalitolerans]|uniref:aldo/keto reductase n=1 Tax=Paenibacillus alkalitolerans TaxID=2799335 RepID=UPI0018F5E382|nr:aldo/keto reductase [Paenibacillus alkalitolerans]